MDQPQPPLPPEPRKPSWWGNAIASYMSRHIRHTHASSNEWVQVHRDHGGGGEGGGGGQRHDFLGAIEAFLHDHGATVHIPRPDFHAEGHAALLPVELLVAGAVVTPIDDDRLICVLVEEVPRQGGVSLAGLGRGAIFMMGRALVGVYEMVTFPIPYPAHYKPVLQPEFEWQHLPSSDKKS